MYWEPDMSIDFFIGLFLATLIVALFTSRLYRLILWYSANSMVLGILALIVGTTLDDRALLLTGIASIVLKGAAIAWLLKYLSEKYGFTRQIQPRIKTQYAIILIPMILVFTFYLAEPISHMVEGNPNYVAISISSLFLALLLMMEHHHVMPKIIGFLTMENALFLLGVTATEGMPMLVELGIFFDLLMAIVVINLLFHKEEASS